MAVFEGPWAPKTQGQPLSFALGYRQKNGQDFLNKPRLTSKSAQNIFQLAGGMPPLVQLGRAIGPNFPMSAMPNAQPAIPSGSIQPWDAGQPNSGLAPSPTAGLPPLQPAQASQMMGSINMNPSQVSTPKLRVNKVSSLGPSDLESKVKNPRIVGRM